MESTAEECYVQLRDLLNRLDELGENPIMVNRDEIAGKSAIVYRPEHPYSPRLKYTWMMFGKGTNDYAAEGG